MPVWVVYLPLIFFAVGTFLVLLAAISLRRRSELEYRRLRLDIFFVSRPRSLFSPAFYWIYRIGRTLFWGGLLLSLIQSSRIMFG
jgi:hypothetical protein